jgi:hypothetical protein
MPESAPNDFAPVLLYDGVCGFCSRVVQFVLRVERRNTLRFAALQGKYGQEIVAQPRVLQGVDSMAWVSRPPPPRAQQCSRARRPSLDCWPTWGCRGASASSAVCSRLAYATESTIGSPDGDSTWFAVRRPARFPRPANTAAFSIKCGPIGSPPRVLWADVVGRRPTVQVPPEWPVTSFCVVGEAC